MEKENVKKKGTYYNLPIFVENFEDVLKYPKDQHIDYMCKKCGANARTIAGRLKKHGRLYCGKCNFEISRQEFLEAKKNGTYEPTVEAHIISLDEASSWQTNLFLIALFVEQNPKTQYIDSLKRISSCVQNVLRKIPI